MLKLSSNVNECKPLAAGAAGAARAAAGGGEGGSEGGGGVGQSAADVAGAASAVADAVDGDGGRGLHSFRFQLNLSSSVHRVTQLNPECVLELLKLSSNVNECQPLHGGGAFKPSITAPPFIPKPKPLAAAVAEAGAYTRSTFRLNVGAFCRIGGHLGAVHGVFRRCWGILWGI